MELNYVEYRPNAVLDYIGRMESVTLRELSNFLGYSRQITSGILSDLERGCLVAYSGYRIIRPGRASRTYGLTQLGKERMVEDFGVVKYALEELQPDATEFMSRALNRSLGIDSSHMAEEELQTFAREVFHRTEEAFTAEQLEDIRQQLKDFFS